MLNLKDKMYLRGGDKCVEEYIEEYTWKNIKKLQGNNKLLGTIWDEEFELP